MSGYVYSIDLIFFFKRNFYKRLLILLKRINNFIILCYVDFIIIINSGEYILIINMYFYLGYINCVCKMYFKIKIFLLYLYKVWKR